MSTHEEKTIGALSIDALLAELMQSKAEDRGLPRVGGEYDTRRGWAERLKLGKDTARKVIEMMLRTDRAKVVSGMYPNGKRWVTGELIQSAALLEAERQLVKDS